MLLAVTVWGVRLAFAEAKVTDDEMHATSSESTLVATVQPAGVASVAVFVAS